jgi:hypothetical protein
MLEERFPIESQVGLIGVIASNSAKLANANFGGITKGATNSLKRKGCPSTMERISGTIYIMVQRL